MKKLIFTLAILIGSSSFLNAQNKKNKKPYIDVWGIIQTDIIYDIKQMDPDWVGGFRPSKIPVYPDDPGWGTYGHTYFSVRPSTFKFEGVLPTNHNWGAVRLRFEFDLFGMGVHAGETSLRFRIAYGDWGPLRIGKDWSTFIDLSAFPNNYEWWGPSGMALVPSVMVRYTKDFSEKSKFEISLESPGSEIDAGKIREIDPNLLNVNTKEILPDLIARYSLTDNFGSFKIAAMVRNLEYEVISIDFEKAENRSKFGWGINLTSNINIFQNKGVLHLQTVFGEGYAGYNNDGGVELAPDENNLAVTPFQFGFAAFYDHHITNRLTGSIGFSETNQKNSAGQLEETFHKSYYSVTQLIYEVLKDKIFMGVNYQYGKKFNKDLASADDQRILFTAQYRFNFMH